jgi:pSer/pThr/pTyr-binding forkhead associated (FHA) protein
MVEPKSAAAAFLEVVESPSLRDAVRIEGETTVGRKPEGAAVKGLGDRYMSARHARFHLSSGKLFVTDLDSRNRTFLNDEPLPPHQAVSVAVGDTVRMGTTTLRLARIG